MGNANKTTAAVIGGAVVTVLASLANGIWHYTATPELMGAVQTLAVAAVVYWSPANRPS